MLEKVHKIITWLIRLFIDACGITLLIMFFYWEPDLYNRGNISLVVFEIYLFLLIIAGFSWLFSGSLFRNKEEYTQMQISQEVKKLISAHEAGHAIVCQKLQFPVNYINVSMQTNSCISTTISYKNEEDIRKVILVLYAGAVAEELCYKERLPGNNETSESDFKRANKLLKEYIVLKDNTVSKTYLDVELADKMITYSKQFYEESREILLANEEMLHDLSIKLYEEGSMSKKQVEDFFKEKQMA